MINDIIFNYMTKVSSLSLLLNSTIYITVVRQKMEDPVAQTAEEVVPEVFT